MWGWPVNIFAFFLLITTFFVLIWQGANPEKIVVGKWKEVAWEYEKVDRNENSPHTYYKEIPSHVKDKIGQDLIIHQAEIWEFKPNGSLILHGKDKPPTVVKWRLKGRGHVLKLKYANNLKEYYDFSIERNEMTLHFDIDMQVRGIAKLKFKKID